MEIKNLESKIWFRFLKVIFVFAYIVAFLAVLVFAYSSKPYATNDEYNSKIVCDNGKEYKAGDVGIDAYIALAEQLGGFATGNAPWEGGAGATPAKNKATMLCLGYIPHTLTEDRRTQLDSIVKKMDSQGAPSSDIQVIVNDFKLKFGQPEIAPSYKVEIVKKTVGNWWGFIRYTILTLFIVFVIFELIRRTFLYVVIGKRFLK